MTATSISGTARENTADAFGNLIDLARLRTGSAHAEVCEFCNTINMGAARTCKCCARKLPAFYGSESACLMAVRTGSPSLARLWGQWLGRGCAAADAVVAQLAWAIGQPLMPRARPGS